MATPDRRQSTGVDRRASVRTSMAPQLSTEMDDDIYGMEAMGVSDGFRPTSVRTSHVRSVRMGQSAGRRSTPPPRPSSITKPKNLDSFALRHDGSSIPAPLLPALTGSSSMSVTSHDSTYSDATIIRPESPYQGPSGPSHPYQMYPQNIRPARSASVATTSTFQAQPDRPYSGPNGPTHPYGLYPQDTMLDPQDSNENLGVGIQVGFPGRGVEYRRRLGPDGEEAADLIGPYGHTEQLPPYTKFAVGSFGKDASNTLPAIEGAGGIGLATRNPEFESQEDILSPQPTRYARSLTSESTTQLDSRPFVGSEKPDEKKWKRVARKKLCGIVPVWVVVLLGVFILLFLLIIGTALGIGNRLKNSAHKSDTPSSSPTTVTSTVDVSPITSAPAGLSPLPTGSFNLQVGPATSADSTCIKDRIQESAWNCSNSQTTIQMTVSTIPSSGDTDRYRLRIAVIEDGISQITFGSQLPQFDGDRVLSLYWDGNPFQSALGPAWFFQGVYDKLVILPENMLSTTPNSKRGYVVDGFEKKDIAGPGDKLWYCYWRNTTIETFIYPNATSAAGASSLALTSTMKPAAASAGKPTSTARSMATVSATPDQASYALYPRVIKVEEVSPQRVSPYCVQMQVAEDGYNVIPYFDQAGNQPTILISEVIPTPLDMRSLVERQSASCSCVWHVT